MWARCSSKNIEYLCNRYTCPFFSPAGCNALSAIAIVSGALKQHLFPSVCSVYSLNVCHMKRTGVGQLLKYIHYFNLYPCHGLWQEYTQVIFRTEQLGILVLALFYLASFKNSLLNWINSTLKCTYFSILRLFIHSWRQNNFHFVDFMCT